MLPLALRIAWFVLSFTGMLSCWAVFAAFANLLGSYWWAIAYCVGVGLLEGLFCLGMVWKMDPVHMPHSFCLAQTYISAFAVFLLAGVISSFTMALYKFVTHPKQWPDGEKRVLLWRLPYAFPLLVFPILGSVAQISATLKLDAVQPAGGLSCDGNNPIWTRFLGYAGIPLIVCIPSIFVTGFCMSRVIKTHQHISRSRSRYAGGLPFDPFSAAPISTAPQRRSITPLPATVPSLSSGGFPVGAATAARGAAEAKSSRPSSTMSAIAQELQLRSSDSTNTHSSVFPTFAPPSKPSSVVEREAASVHTMDEKEEWCPEETDASNTDVDGNGIDMPKWPQSEERLPAVYAKKFGCDCEEPYEDPSALPKSRHSGVFQQRARRPMYCNLPPPICRILRYTMTFNLIQLVSSISTLVYVVRGHASPFIPFYVSLLLYAWAPVVFFASLPTVRLRLKFWQR